MSLSLGHETGARFARLLKILLLFSTQFCLREACYVREKNPKFTETPLHSLAITDIPLHLHQANI